MKNLLILLVAVLLPAVSHGSRQRSFESGLFEKQDDPAYQLYKTGYNLVLQSDWKGAQRKFEEIIKLYPKSSYRDDANYWYAYSLKYVNERQAFEALKKFLKEFPKSSYRGDALEDLAELQTRIRRNIVVTGDSIVRGRVRVAIPDIQVEFPDIAVTPHPDLDPDFPIGDRNAVWIFSNEMQDDMEWGYGYWPLAGTYRNLDQNTRLKISALRGIAADRDSESFQTVRDLLMDRNEDSRLREEALRIFSRYEKFDVLPTLKDVAKNDPDRRLRHGAIYYIGKHRGDKDAAVGILIELYAATPKDSARLKERFLYSIARTGTNRGSDFLVSVAKSSEDYGLRESALYWLGKYGEGKKKKALYEILKQK
jgi:tetratricopeptide (TPR) repeat protein